MGRRTKKLGWGWSLGMLALLGVTALGDERGPTALAAIESTTNGEGPGPGPRSFWSFEVPLSQPRPKVRDVSWPREPVDWFILEGLEREGLEPSPEADRRTLARRVSFDLTGLPPTPEDRDEFLADPRPDAYRRLVERLLASPRLGERLASLWLPLARYAEDQAHQVGDDTSMAYPNAHLYREWVIDAFNRDLPYDQFLRLQLAADKIGNGTDDLAALGFLGLGPKYYNRGRLEVQADEWEDRVDTVTRTVLGLTVACARCHDHKFDPIPTRDYYAMAGVFASTRMVNKTPGGEVIDGKVKANKMPADAIHMVEDGDARDLPVFIRGNVTRPGPVAERGFLSVLDSASDWDLVSGSGSGSKSESGSESDAHSDSASIGARRFKEGSGRRELAERLTDPGNPLTARVFVNRIWGLCFGKPLVATPSDFGHSGMQPTHAALLDDLAVRFMKGGWSVHALIRELVGSATYRQSSRARPEGVAADASNQLLWRMNRRRLTVEQWRDTVLAVSGNLDWSAGRSLELSDPGNRRRTVHARISRLKLNDLLMQFDYPDANVHAEKRSVTTTATQKLFLLNSPFVLEQARALAAVLQKEVPDSDRERIHRAHRLTTGRAPDPEEEAWAMEFLRKPTAAGMTRWEQYAQVLLVSNEMLYVD
ncbi:MAG: DUF1549 and DUF1553 domain-containing protein [Limisphaerales bacterium]